MIQALSLHQLADLHTRFLMLLPKIETHGRIYFLYLRPHRKEEALQEMRALAWLWFRRLVPHPSLLYLDIRKPATSQAARVRKRTQRDAVCFQK
jgi:hypothetical protein